MCRTVIVPGRSARESKEMRIITAIALILTFLGGGVARLVLAFQPPVKRPASEAPLSKTGLVTIALVNIVVSTAGMICLLLNIFGPWEILFGALIITSLVEIIIRVRSGASLWPKFQ